MSLFSQLKSLQWKQLQHDEKYHKEICLLTVQQRITHMTLHLSKYSAKLVSAAASNDQREMRKAVIDTLIIAFSSANIFGTLISSIAFSEEELLTDSIDDLSEKLLSLEQQGRLGYALELAIKINAESGKMCKSVESLDHLEAHPFKESLLNRISQIFRCSLAIAKHLEIVDICKEIEERLYFVEQKHIFFEELGNYKQGYKDVLER